MSAMIDSDQKGARNAGTWRGLGFREAVISLFLAQAGSIGALISIRKVTSPTRFRV